MRAARAVFFALLVAALAGGLYTGAREWFLLFFILLFLLLFGLGLALYTAVSFTYVQTLARSEAEQGERVDLHLEIHNDKIYPFPMMRVRTRAVTAAESRTLPMSLAPGEKAVFDLPVTSAYRGEFGVGMTVVEIQDVFGLFCLPFPLLRLPYYRLRPLFIVPRSAPMSYPPGRAQRRGDYAGARPGPEQPQGDFCGVRDYRAGDRESRIHWKLSAARGQLFSRAFEQPAQPRCVLFLDTASGGRGGEEALLYETLLCSCAATLARHCLAQSYAVRLVAPEPARPLEGERPADYEAAARWLALIPFGRGGVGERMEGEMIAAREESLVAVLTLGDPAPLAGGIRRAVAGGHTVLVVRAAPRGALLPPLPAGAADVRVAPGDDPGVALGGAL